MDHLDSSIRPVEAKRAYTQIVDRIAALVRTGEFPPGTRLPPERELSQRFGVGRPTLREALSALQMLGIVETRRGQGTYIVQASVPLTVDESRLDAEAPFTILEARYAIEPCLAGVAAEHCGSKSMVRLAEVLAAMERNLSDEASLLDEIDREFHLAVAQATDNSVLADLGQHIHTLMSQDLWLAMQNQINAAYPGRWKLALREHRAVYGAIAAGNAKQASSRARHHLASVRHLMLEVRAFDAGGADSDTKS